MEFPRRHMAGFFTALFCCFFGLAAQAEPLPVLRISTENNQHHVQTKVIGLFAGRLREKLKGKLAVEHYHSARLFRDRRVVKALADGKVEMAVPGTWQLDRFEPSVGLFLLPMFYGRNADFNHRLRDTEIGQEINSRIGKSLDVTVLGRWIDLGHAHLYSVKKPIESHADLNGMRIRIPGGIANAGRLKAFGAIPEVIPWPDLPQALTFGKIDGVLTTHATVASARLWEKGIRYAFEDKQYFPQYIPIISSHFWNKLPGEIQQTIRETWESVVDEGRSMAAAAQRNALTALRVNGISVVTPSPKALAQKRKDILPQQAEISARMGVDPALIKTAETLINAKKLK